MELAGISNIQIRRGRNECSRCSLLPLRQQTLCMHRVNAYSGHDRVNEYPKRLWLAR